MTLIRPGAALVGFVVAVIQIRLREGNYVACPGLLGIIDRVRPGVSGLRGEAVGEALLELQRETGIPGLAAVFHLIDVAVTIVDLGRRRPERRSERTDLVVVDVVDDVSAGGGGRAQIHIPRSPKAHAVSVNAAGGEIDALADLTLDRECCLLGVRIVEVRRRRRSG